MHTHKTPAERLSKLDAALGLSPAQHAHAKLILEQAAQAHLPDLTRHARRLIRGQTDDKLLAILEPEQQTTFEQLKQQRRAQRLERRLDRMNTALDLSPEQHKQIKTIMEQATPHAQHDAALDALKDEHPPHHAKIMAALNDAQRAKHQTHLDQRRLTRHA